MTLIICVGDSENDFLAILNARMGIALNPTPMFRDIAHKYNYKVHTNVDKFITYLSILLV